MNRAHGQPRSPSRSPGCDTWQPRAFWSHSAPRTWLRVSHQGGLQLDGTSQDDSSASAVNLLISHDATQDALPQHSRTSLGMSLSLCQSSQQVTSSPCFQHPLSNGMPAESCLSFCTVHTPRSTVLLWLSWPLSQKPFAAGLVLTLAQLH